MNFTAAGLSARRGSLSRWSCSSKSSKRTPVKMNWLRRSQQSFSRQSLRAQAAITQTVSRTSAARTRRHRRPDGLPLLRLGQAVEARRGHYRDPGGHSASVEGHPDGAGEVHLPRVREDCAAAGPFHVTPRGFAGPNLLAMILFEKFAQHQPLNRQSERYAREGVTSACRRWPTSGACTSALKPIHSLIEAHVLAAERLHGDDTTVPILAKGKTDTGRIWTYVRDDRRRSRAITAGGTLLCIARPPTGASGTPSEDLHRILQAMPMAVTIRCSR